MKNNIYQGDSVTLTAPVGGVVSGNGYKIGQLFVIAFADQIAGEPFAGVRVGAFNLPKNTAQALTEGALVYWDNSAGEVTTTSVGNLLIGAAIDAAGAAATTANIILNANAALDS